MSDILKKLTEKIKEEQTRKTIVQEEQKTEELNLVETLIDDKKELLTQKKNLDENENISKKSKKVDTLIMKIKASNKNSKITDKMIHIRLEEKVVTKLKILNAYNLTTQSILAYLISEFLEKEDIKNLIKKIIENDLE